MFVQSLVKEESVARSISVSVNKIDNGYILHTSVYNVEEDDFGNFQPPKNVQMYFPAPEAIAEAVTAIFIRELAEEQEEDNEG
jgi:hypothetical protein